jgi:hypothetical protein
MQEAGNHECDTDRAREAPPSRAKGEDPAERDHERRGDPKQQVVPAQAGVLDIALML